MTSLTPFAIAQDFRLRQGYGGQVLRPDSRCNGGHVGGQADFR